MPISKRKLTNRCLGRGLCDLYEGGLNSRINQPQEDGRSSCISDRAVGSGNEGRKLAKRRIVFAAHFLVCVAEKEITPNAEALGTHGDGTHLMHSTGGSNSKSKGWPMGWDPLAQNLLWRLLLLLLLRVVCRWEKTLLAARSSKMPARFCLKALYSPQSPFPDRGSRSHWSLKSH